MRDDRFLPGGCGALSSCCPFCPSGGHVPSPSDAAFRDMGRVSPRRSFSLDPHRHASPLRLLREAQAGAKIRNLSSFSCSPGCGISDAGSVLNSELRLSWWVRGSSPPAAPPLFVRHKGFKDCAWTCEKHRVFTCQRERASVPGQGLAPALVCMPAHSWSAWSPAFPIPPHCG